MSGKYWSDKKNRITKLSIFTQSAEFFNPHFNEEPRHLLIYCIRYTSAVDMKLKIPENLDQSHRIFF